MQFFKMVHKNWFMSFILYGMICTRVFQPERDESNVQKQQAPQKDVSRKGYVQMKKRPTMIVHNPNGKLNDGKKREEQ